MSPHILDSITESLRREFDESASQAAGKARAALLQSLNQAFRRLRAYKGETEWTQVTLDAAAGFAPELFLFAVVDDRLELRGQRPAVPDSAVTFPIASARAFASVLEQAEPVTALRTAAEVSAALSSSGDSAQRAHLFPIANGARMSAVLFASGDGCDMNGLELVAGMASAVLERKSNVTLHSQIAPATPKPAPPPEAAKLKLPEWGDLPPDQRQVHLRAQRFARVTIAEMQLSRPEACRAGREQGDLYLFLKREIDKARENFRKQFMTAPSMVDYLHLELLQTAADGDERKLGADYPGRLQ